MYVMYNSSKVQTVFGLLLVLLSLVSACKSPVASSVERKEVAPSMLNILQAQDREAGAGTERTIDTSRRIRKIENKNGITYKKVNRKMVERLRQELNAIPPDRNDPWDVRLPSSGVTTSCSFLSGSPLTTRGRCTGGGSCRDGNLEYGNNVSMQERVELI